MNKLKNVDPEEIRRKYKSGMSTNELDNEYGVPHCYTARFMREHKIPKRTISEAQKLKWSKKPKGVQSMTEVNQQSEQILNLKPTTTRGKVMEAIAIKTEDERNKAITEVKEIANTLARDIEALKAQKAEKDAVMQRLDSDLREMGILSVRKKEVVKARLALLKAESESIQEDIKIKADEWRKADCAFFQLTKVSAIDDTIQELRSEMDNIQTLITTLQDNQSSLKQMIVKQVISK